MKHVSLAHTAYALWALSPWGRIPVPPPPAHALRTDSAATTAILDEFRGYYRDLHDRNWASMVTHFYPAKVTARFAVPDGDSAWMALAVPAADPHSAPDAHGYCVPNMGVAIVGHWARVRARRCTHEVDEAWFYEMSGRWKIIHLRSGAPLTTTLAPAQPERGTSRGEQLLVSFAHASNHPRQLSRRHSP